MSEYSDKACTKKKELFINVWKKIEPYIRRRELTKDRALQEGYKNDIIETYNDYVEYISDAYSFVSKSKQTDFDRAVLSANEKLKKAFRILNLEYSFDRSVYAQIDANRVTNLTTTVSTSVPDLSASTDKFTAGGSGLGDSSKDLSEASSNKTENIETLYESETENSEQEDIEALNVSDDNIQINSEGITVATPNEFTMVQTVPEFLKVAASIINYKFNGDPLKLEGFLTDVELVQEVAEANNTNVCFKFLKSILEAKALECLPEAAQCTTIKHITDALLKNIKPESSESKMMALGLDHGNFTKFNEQAEKLAEAFKRSLIVEGISKTKAEEMAIKKTVDLCRKTARSEVVKSVLASTKFAAPADVLAKFVTENDVAYRERKEANNFKNNGNNQRKFNKFDKNKKHNSQQNPQQNQNNQNKGGQKYFGKKNYQNKQGKPNSGEHTIRIVAQGNAPGPSTGGNQQNEQEQVVHFPLN